MRLLTNSDCEGITTSLKLLSNCFDTEWPIQKLQSAVFIHVFMSNMNVTLHGCCNASAPSKTIFLT